MLHTVGSEVLMRKWRRNVGGYTVDSGTKLATSTFKPAGTGTSHDSQPTQPQH